jgi:hypothetical protein
VIGRQSSLVLNGVIGCFLLALMIGSPWTVRAEATYNKAGLFDSITVCPAYKKFLEGKPVSEVGSCKQLTALLIKSQHLDPMDSFNKYQEKLRQTSGIGLLMGVVKSAIIGDAETTFYRANWADRQVFSSMSQSQDFERAGVYSGLVSRIRTLAVRSLCGAANRCKALAFTSGVGDVLGSAFFWLDKKKPKTVLLCLLDSDGFVVPVRSVLISAHFRGCLEKMSGRKY